MSAHLRGTWCPWHCGDEVFDVADPRHEGVIESIWNSAVAKVRWNETGWFSEVPLRNLRKVVRPVDPAANLSVKVEQTVRKFLALQGFRLTHFEIDMESAR